MPANFLSGNHLIRPPSGQRFMFHLEAGKIYSPSFPIFRVGRAFKRGNLELHPPFHLSLSFFLFFPLLLSAIFLPSLPTTFRLFFSFPLFYLVSFLSLSLPLSFPFPSLFPVFYKQLFYFSPLSYLSINVLRFLSPTLSRIIHWRHGYRPEIPRLGPCFCISIHVKHLHVYVSSDTFFHLMRMNYTHSFRYCISRRKFAMN